MRVLVEMDRPNTVKNVRDLYRAEGVEDGACTPSISLSCKCGDECEPCALSLASESSLLVPFFFSYRRDN